MLLVLTKLSPLCFHFLLPLQILLSLSHFPLSLPSSLHLSMRCFLSFRDTISFHTYGILCGLPLLMCPLKASSGTRAVRYANVCTSPPPRSLGADEVGCTSCHLVFPAWLSST